MNVQNSYNFAIIFGGKFNMKKRLVVICMVLTMLFSTPISVYAGEGSNRTHGVKHYKESVYSNLTEDKVIQILERYVSVSDEGYIYLKDIPDRVAVVLGDEVIQYYDTVMDELNKLVKSDELYITCNGTIYELSDDEIVVQGGNVDKVVYSWWGYTRYANNSNSKKMVKELNSKANGLSGAGATAALVGCIVPVTKPITAVISASNGIGSAYFKLVAEKIEDKNKGKGVIIKMTWAFVFTVQSQ